MGQFSDKTFLGGGSLLKTAGQNSFAPLAGAQIDIPGTYDPNNPDNWTYPPMLNAAAGQVNGVRGKLTPFFTIVSCWGTWLTAAILNDLLGGSASWLDSFFDTSEYALNMHEPVLGNRIFEGGKCAGVDITYNAAGGPIAVAFHFPAIFGDNAGSLPSFAAYQTFAGEFYNTSNVSLTDLSGTAFDQMDTTTISLVRAQQQQQYSDGTLNPTAVTSGATGGVVTVVQSKTYQVETPVNGLTFTIGGSGTGVRIRTKLNRDNQRAPFQVGRSSWLKQFSIVDFTAVAFGGGGYPYSIDAAP